MPRQPKFTPRNKDIVKLKKLNTSTKRKQRRIKNLYGIEHDIDIKNISSFKSRKEFNKYISELEKFTDRKNFRYVKNKYDVVLSRDEMKEIKQKIKTINKRKNKEYNKIKNKLFKSRGIDTLEKVKDRRLMGDVRYDEFKEKKFNFENIRNKQELKGFLEQINKQVKPNYYSKRQKQYKENYIIALNNVFGELAKNLIKKVRSMSIDEFMNLYYTEDIANVDFMYEFTDLLIKLSELEILFGI